VAGVYFFTTYDILAQTGAPDTALTLTVTVTVGSGELPVAFWPVTGEPKINAIEVRQIW
jgi:hypothetical protein